MVSKPSLEANPYNEFSKNDKESEKARKRFFLIKKILQDHNDADGLKYLEELLDACVRYIESVVNYRPKIMALRERFSGKAFVEQASVIEKSRKRIHDGLIARLQAFNRYIGKKYGWENKDGLIPLGGLYTLEPTLFHKREMIGNWAWYLISGLFSLTWIRG